MAVGALADDLGVIDRGCRYPLADGMTKFTQVGGCNMVGGFTAGIGPVVAADTSPADSLVSKK